MEDNNQPPLAWSDFLAEWAQAHPQRLRALRRDSVLSDPDACAAFVADRGQLTDGGGEKEFTARLRVFRNEAMAAIAWCDLSGAATLEQTLEALSRLADHCVEAALAHAHKHSEQRHGAVDGRLIVIGMGKLGGGELNFSSDIDLVFAHGDFGPSEGARPLEFPEYCKRVAQRLVATLSEQTAQGFAFRVDTRLRPFGDSGALVASIDAMENYYQSHGREWERYAWIKARPVAGDLDGARELIERLRPFVYRRYLDYGAFESVRDMKALIEKQVARRDMEDNIKLGRGGIREIEFIAQAFQLIRGGHEPALQDNRLLPVLARLAQAGHLPAEVATQLHEAYLFLRKLENRLQMWADRQTHELPCEPAQRSALAAAMGYSDWKALDQAVTGWRSCVHEHFLQVFASPHPDAGDARGRELRAAWSDESDDARGIEMLAERGFADPQAAWAGLTDLRGGALFGGLGQRGRRRLAQLVPLVVQAAVNEDAPDEVLRRVAGVLHRIIGRTAYVDLLVENPAVLARLVALCGASAWISRQIEAQPILLDSLLDPRQLYRPPDTEELARLLDAELAAEGDDDLERRMDLLRRFQHEQTLRVAAADITRSMPLMIVSDHLTALAEIIIRAALAEAWRELTARYGQPRLGGDRVAPFVVIGYGKLGGLELGYGSDLDLVFLHGGSDDAATDGKRSLSHSAFFLRLAQRLIHLLSTRTGAGRAYEVDTRLRPSGRSGLLVIGMPAFERYQSEKAWTWEHQALVRARPVAGDPELAEAFHGLRARILGRSRETHELRRQVLSMRERMRAELDHSDDDRFDLKQGRGALVDIEFISQFAVLHWGHRCPELLIFSDTLRALETLESAQLLSYQQTHQLTHAYRDYRRDIHAAALQEAPRSAPQSAYRRERATVIAVWRRLLLQR